MSLSGLVVIVVLRLAQFDSMSATKDVLSEYCEDQTFDATCANDEVVLMNEAWYGRKRIGSCLSHSYGSVGCNVDILSYVDSICSGQRSCRLNVRDLLVYNPCPKDLRGYLEAQYTCIKVVSPDVDQCRQRSLINVADVLNGGGSPQRTELTTPMTGYLSNYVTELTGCGDVDSPWRVHALPGQRVNFTLFDFGFSAASTPDRPSSPSGNSGGQAQHPGAYVCQVLAVIRDRVRVTAAGETICGGNTRYKHIALSNSHDVEIRMGKIRRYILIKYEVVGCPDISVAPDSTFARTSSGAVIGCLHSSDTWRLTCQNNRWSGSYGNCSDDMSLVSGGALARGLLHLPFGINVLIMGIVAILIGLVVLTCGLVYVRRRFIARTSLRSPGLPSSSDDLCYQQKSQTYAEYRVDPAGPPQRHSRPLLMSHRQMQGDHRQLKGPITPIVHPVDRYPSMLSAGPYLYSGNNDDGQTCHQEAARYVEHIYESPTCARKDYEVCKVTPASEVAGITTSVRAKQVPVGATVRRVGTEQRLQQHQPVECDQGARCGLPYYESQLVPSLPGTDNNN